MEAIYQNEVKLVGLISADPDETRNRIMVQLRVCPSMTSSQTQSASVCCDCWSDRVHLDVARPLLIKGTAVKIVGEVYQKKTLLGNNQHWYMPRIRVTKIPVKIDTASEVTQTIALLSGTVHHMVGDGSFVMRVSQGSGKGFTSAFCHIPKNVNPNRDIRKDAQLFLRAEVVWTRSTIHQQLVDEIGFEVCEFLSEPGS